MALAKLNRLLVCALLAATLGAVSPAQTTQGGIVGEVRDEKGASIVGAKISVTSPATGLTRDATTADNGIFRVLALPTGMYDIRAESPGFATTTVTGIEVGIDQIRTLDLALRVSAKAETITVEATANLTQTESSKLGEIIDNRKVEDLPLNGRDFAQLARLNPGVAVSGGGGGQQGGEGNVSGFSSNGQRSTSNNFLVDGVDNNNYFAGEAAQLPSVDSIQEFEVQTNTFAAEYGRNSGSVVNLVTKSGTNQLHGSAYEFFRNDVLDARNFFNKERFPKSGLRLNQFGGTGRPDSEEQDLLLPELRRIPAAGGHYPHHERPDAGRTSRQLPGCQWKPGHGTSELGKRADFRPAIPPAESQRPTGQLYCLA